MRNEPACVLRLVIDLVEEVVRMPVEEAGRTLLEGVELPRVAVPRRHDQALLLVMAALGTIGTPGPFIPKHDGTATT
jgi:hypothetical protein